MHALTKDNIEAVIAGQTPGYALDQTMYCSEEAYRRDLSHVFGRRWILVDHASRIPNTGDYFLFEIGDEQIIIIRQDEQKVGAFFNVCRHRGSRVCLEHQGSVKAMTCPYHAWSYRLDGSLRVARLMPEGFDKSRFGLKACHVQLLNGLIFIHLGEEQPPSLSEQYAEFKQLLEFHGLDRARIAVKKDYPTQANWKLVVENFLECYHCAPAHPEYCSVHPADQLLALGAGPGSGPQEAFEQYMAKVVNPWLEKCAAIGHPTTEVNREEDSIDMAQASRLPLNDHGAVSETKDGGPACDILMGKFAERDGGETAMVFNPVSFVLAFNDFAFMVRFTPRGPMQTDVQMSWLVDESAIEAKDYDPENLIWVWDVTTKQDKTITEDNQAGIRSSRYEPGPYSEHELKVQTFNRWYLRIVGED